MGSTEVTLSSILTWLRGQPWSWRRFPQSEALPLHSGWVDLCDFPKCGKLGSIISSLGDCVRAIPRLTIWHITDIKYKLGVAKKRICHAHVMLLSVYIQNFEICTYKACWVSEIYSFMYWFKLKIPSFRLKIFSDFKIVTKFREIWLHNVHNVLFEWPLDSIVFALI